MTQNPLPQHTGAGEVELRGVYVIAVTGLPGVKKHALCSILRERYGIPSIGLSSVLLAAANKERSDSYEAIRESGRDIKASLGADAVARMASAAIVALGSGLVCVDGIRDFAEAQFFGRFASGCLLIAVHGSPDSRFALPHHCTWIDNPFATRARFDARDEDELNLGVGRAMALADAHVVNEHYAQPLETQLDAVIRWAALHRGLPLLGPAGQIE